MKHIPGSNDRPDWPLAVVFSAGGLGMAVARRLGQTHRLLLVDRDEGLLKRQTEALEAAGYDIMSKACNVTSTAEIEQVAATAADLGDVQALAYVLGLSPGMGDFRTIMQVNLIAAAQVIHRFANQMVPGGAALMIASLAAHMVPAEPDILSLLDKPLEPDFLDTLEAKLGKQATSASAYTLSKKGLIRLCQHRAGEWGAHGQRILSLSPGLIATPQGAREYENSPSKYQLFEAIALKREATMLEISGIAEFLLSDRASFLTGIDILADGGLTANLGCRPFS